MTFALLLSYPNPFTDRTTLVYRIPEQRTSDLRVRLAIYDTLGRRVQNLVDDQRFPGTFSVVWDGRDGQGQPAAAGVYLCHMLTDTHQETIRVVRL